MTNRLAGETSPYLLQHADNPVDWYPWGEQALALSRDSDRPILLSIGYSACHWCHVMAHESFEDDGIAALMNAHFVNVKVDREERPDLDQIYQNAHHLLTGRSGGWPLNLFLTPDGTPFFAGTYFPRTSRYGLPGFADVLERIARVYRERRRDIEEQNASLRQALANIGEPPLGADGELDAKPVAALRELLARSFDPVHGGFGGAPKFPHTPDLAFLLRRLVLDGDALAREMLLKTLDGMAAGGIFDHLGGGFARYSVDERWMIPHFEKMLYDNGPLLRLYAEAAVLTGEVRYAHVAQETAAWVMREMEAPGGGYYSSLDADSEGEEGKFYVWSPEEVRTVLAESEYRLFARRYGLDRPPNFENRHWHLHENADVGELAAAFAIDPDDCERLLARCRARLLEARELRVRPGRDDKLLTSWNALMIDGMARAGTLLGRADWIASARRAAEFLRANVWRDGRLLATCKDGRAHLDAYLDDHAFLLAALLELMQAEFRLADLHWAIELADALLERFEDRAHGGFYFTGHDHEALIARTRTIHDNAVPSGNAVAAFALQRLAHLSGQTRYAAAARRCLQRLHAQAQASPAGMATSLVALEECLHPPTLIVLRGPAAEVHDWRKRLAGCMRPDMVVIAPDEPADALPAMLGRPAGPGVNAWICSGVTCLPPVSDWTELERVCNPRHIG